LVAYLWLDELSEVELSEVDEPEFVWPTAHATRTVPATPVAARAAVIPPTLRSPLCRVVATA
jgi:hypothetical protein